MHHAQNKRDSFYLEDAQWVRGRNIVTFLALTGIVACVAGFATDRVQFFRSYLVSFSFATTIMLGAMFFTMIQFLTGSAWSVPVRRFMETIAATMVAYNLALASGRGQVLYSRSQLVDGPTFRCRAIAEEHFGVRT